jgi:hypothetical protein
MDAVSFRVSASFNFPRQRASFQSIRARRIPKRSCSVRTPISSKRLCVAPSIELCKFHCTGILGSSLDGLLSYSSNMHSMVLDFSTMLKMCLEHCEMLIMFFLDLWYGLFMLLRSSQTTYPLYMFWTFRMIYWNEMHFCFKVRSHSHDFHVP